MSLSPFEHPFLSGLFADAEIGRHLGADADIDAMIAFEIALARAEAECGVIPHEAARAIETLAADWRPDMEKLRAGVGRDGVVVADLIAQMRSGLDDDTAPHLHFGATSQDVIDTSLVLRLKAIIDLLDARLSGLIACLDAMAGTLGPNALMGRTRMQDALPITVADRLTDWATPLVRDRQRLEQIKPRLLTVQFGGAVGTREKLGDKAQAVTDALAGCLELNSSPKAWHSQRDNIVEFANWLALVSGSLGKIGQDIALLAQSHDGSIVLPGGGSSAMAHKSNPVGAEVLVALARHAAGLSGTMGQAMVHEQERSGAAWTLEWLVLPQLIMTTGSATLSAQRLLESITALGHEGRLP